MTSQRILYYAYLLQFFVLLVVLTGCTQGAGHQHDTSAPLSLTPVEAKLIIEPTISVGNAVTLQIHVVQSGQAVTDAKEVSFEIWQTDGKHETVPAVHVGNGMYETKYTFTASGKTDVIYHITARDMHVMDKQQLLVH